MTEECWPWETCRSSATVAGQDQSSFGNLG